MTGLDEANYDKSKCQDYFDAYKECKKQEVTVKFSPLSFKFPPLVNILCLFMFTIHWKLVRSLVEDQFLLSSFHNHQSMFVAKEPCHVFVFFNERIE